MKTVDSITKGLTKMVADLETLREKLIVKRTKLNQKMVDTEIERTVVIAEQDKAERIIGRINNIVA